MTNSQCDLSNPNFVYPYCPSFAAAVLFAVLFGLPTAFHVYQAVQYRKPFASILIMAGIWETAGYIFRSLSIQSPFSASLQTAQLLLILLAPLWINAFIYMLVGRMIHFFLDNDRVFGIKARKMTLIFVMFDVTAFLVQATGGSMSSSNDNNTALLGLHIYTGGVALQLLFNVFFLAIVVKFQKTATPLLRAASAGAYSYQDCAYLLRLVYTIMGLLIFRNIYRLVEFAAGLNSTFTKHEWYAYVFDAVPMLAALVILNVFHPGQKLQGPRCDFSEETRAIKQAKKARKAAKKTGKTNKRELEKMSSDSSQGILGDDRV